MGRQRLVLHELWQTVVSRSEARRLVKLPLLFRGEVGDDFLKLEFLDSL
ncbi:hypothetical protein HKBW3S47_01911 [Candidatus Hakubella thermalkaliphila]|uniref:Uncharacterized protein n=1 Tax=Candidatus Hakubella thermalkaliphila TaxID=2754717 RepID=A0A6V8Q653_9ACTN|nr:hypothetical protein HKBW3S47_01911 [Candidatus Hakubella thermalkaliphila]